MGCSHFIFTILAFWTCSSTIALKIGLIEFNPTIKTSENASEILEENINQIRNELDLTKDAMDVLVFPEYGLSGYTTNYSSFAMHIPKIEAEIPDYKDIILRISDIAKEYRKHLIVQLFENSTADNRLYSTAVVFDYDGKIISKHRKLSLSAEEKKALYPGQNATEVTLLNERLTLTFGEDLFTSNPPSTSAVIVLSSLVHRIPYENALSLYSGYALNYKKDILVSGLNQPSTGRSGTGTFLYNAVNNSLTSNVYLSGEDTINEIISDVTAKTSMRSSVRGPVLRGLPNTDKLANLAYRNNSGLETNQKLLLESNTKLENAHFVCELVNYTSDGDVSNKYKFVSQSGEWSIGNSTYKYMFCGIAVDADILGGRNKTNINITNLNLKLTLKNNSTTVYPISSDYNLQPASQLSFTKYNSSIDISAKDSSNVLYLGYMVLIAKSSAFTYTMNMVVGLLPLVVMRIF